jgi:hypothetical protein
MPRDYMLMKIVGRCRTSSMGINVLTGYHTKAENSTDCPGRHIYKTLQHILIQRDLDNPLACIVFYLLSTWYSSRKLLLLLS